MNAEAVIIDGYVDEPACLGVPPYISPYIRNLAGVLKSQDYQVGYMTIDQIRQDPALLSGMSSTDISIVVAGVTVPGKYLGGTPATLVEIQQIGRTLSGTRLLAGPIAFGYASEGGKKAVRQEISGFDHLLSGSPAEALDAFLHGGGTHGTLDYRRSDEWSVLGSGIIRMHPSFPFAMCEIETARGCSRAFSGGCSFCTEPFYGPPRYRPIEGIMAEIEALYCHGARHFRLGRQPDILTYGAGTGEFPSPIPEKIEELFSGVRGSAPQLKTLHIDNINPGTISRHEDASRCALRAIISYHTPGDVAAFGVESADPEVILANNLKAGPEDVMKAVRVVNEEGGMRRDGIPELLPGLNFIAGLAGETPETYRCNEKLLDDLLEAGLLVRRVNIRQLMPFENTRAYTDNTLKKNYARFRQFKEYTRNRFDLPMLRLVFPTGTVLRDVIVELPGDISFGRQMGSYPILAGIPILLPARQCLDIVVVDHGMRSVTGLPVPIAVNDLPAGALRWIPSVGRKKAGLIAAKRPFRNLHEFRKISGPTPVDKFLSFSHLL